MNTHRVLLTAVSDRLQYMGRALRTPYLFSIHRGGCYYTAFHIKR